MKDYVFNMFTSCAGDHIFLNIVPGTSNQNELEEEETAEISVPQELLNIIPEGEDVNIAVVVFNETTLFPIREPSTNETLANDTVLAETVVGSQVISIQVAGVETGTTLEVPVRMLFLLKQIENGAETNVENPVCVFWDFNAASK